MSYLTLLYYYFTLHNLTLFDLTIPCLPYFKLLYLTLYYLTLLYLTLPYLTSPYLALPYLYRSENTTSLFVLFPLQFFTSMHDIPGHTKSVFLSRLFPLLLPNVHTGPWTEKLALLTAEIQTIYLTLPLKICITLHWKWWADKEELTCVRGQRFWRHLLQLQQPGTVNRQPSKRQHLPYQEEATAASRFPEQQHRQFFR